MKYFLSCLLVITFVFTGFFSFPASSSAQTIEELQAQIVAQLMAIIQTLQQTQSQFSLGTSIRAGTIAPNVLNVRSGAGISNSIVGQVPSGIRGNIMSSTPIQNGNYTWWQVQFGDISGWAVENWIQKVDDPIVITDPLCALINCDITVLTPKAGDRIFGTVYISWKPFLDHTTTKAYLQQKSGNSFVELGEALPSRKGSIYWSGDIDSYDNRPLLSGQFRFRLHNSQTEAEAFSGEFTLLPKDYIGNIVATLDGVEPGGVDTLNLPAEGKTVALRYNIGRNLINCNLILQGSSYPYQKTIISGLSKTNGYTVTRNVTIDPTGISSFDDGSHQIELICDIQNATTQPNISVNPGVFFRVNFGDNSGEKVIIDRVVGQTGQNNVLVRDAVASKEIVHIHGVFPNNVNRFYVVTELTSGVGYDNDQSRYSANLLRDGTLGYDVPSLDVGTHNLHVEYQHPSQGLIKSNVLSVQVVEAIPPGISVPTLNQPTAQLPIYVGGKDFGSVHGTGLNGSTVYFNGKAIDRLSYLRATDTQISFPMKSILPLAQGQYPVYVRNSAGRSNTIYAFIQDEEPLEVVNNSFIPPAARTSAMTDFLIGQTIRPNTTSTLNVRENPCTQGSSPIIARLGNEARGEILAEFEGDCSNDNYTWYQVDFDSVTGWVPSSFIIVPSAVSALPSASQMATVFLGVQGVLQNISNFLSQ